LAQTATPLPKAIPPSNANNNKNNSNPNSASSKNIRNHHLRTTSDLYFFAAYPIAPQDVYTDVTLDFGKSIYYLIINKLLMSHSCFRVFFLDLAPIYPSSLI
jgi:hypothetical protein